MEKRAVTYARVSSDDRSNDGRNLAGQLEMGREYCPKRGYQIVAELAEDDRGASGASFELEQLKRMWEMAQAGDFDVLVVRELDRLSRNLAKQLIVEEELRRCGVSIEYVLGEYPDTPEGNLNKQLRGAIAEFEREKIKERMTRGKRLKVKAGSVMIGGSAPYGYTVEQEDHKFVLRVYEPEARVVRMVYNWYAYGDENGNWCGILGITDRLSRLKVPTRYDIAGPNGKPKLRGHGEWCPAQVAQILTREVYRGVWSFGKRGPNGKGNGAELLTVKVPPIVDDDLWRLVKERKAQNRRRLRVHHYLLSSRIRCGHCGAGVSGAISSRRDRPEPYLYYRCNTRRGFSIRKPCDITMFRADRVDWLVWDWVCALLSDPATLEEGLQAEQSEREKLNAPLIERMGVVDDLLAENRTQLQRLLDLYLTGEFERDTLLERKTRLETTISGLVRERANLESTLQAQSLTQDQIWSIQRFAKRVMAGLRAASDNFPARREIIETLDVTATISVEKGVQVVYAQCVLGEKVISVITDHDS